MSELCDKQQKEDKLTPLLLVFLEDPNKWVKIAAYK